ncbi:hypothetical protein DRP04_09950 [Archaeoglobales archaeon]|nr:MAG: hypothetical protein DRP04_09950 [Archaeoglobales archaeon]
MPKKKRKITKGKLNKMIDNIFHKFGDNIYASLIDSFMHMAVEDNLEESIIKFIRYNLGWVIRCLSKRIQTSS